MVGFNLENATPDQFRLMGDEPNVQQPVEQPVDQPVEQPDQQPVEQQAEPVHTEPVKTEVVQPPAPEAFKFKDEFIENLVKYYEETGDVTPYLAAKTTNFEAMSDEDIARQSLMEEYPDFPKEAFETLYKKKVIDAYSLDADIHSYEDVLVGRELFKREMNRKRSEYLDWQKKFSAPSVDRQKEQEDIQKQYQ